MMRAAIYARFSSENQSDSSITDQIEICTRYIAKNSWTAVTTYSDAAMSGARGARTTPGTFSTRTTTSSRPDQPQIPRSGHIHRILARARTAGAHTPLLVQMQGL